jgi:hypothetical protein
MSEREKQNRFLKELIQTDNSDECRQLQARIRKAERDERCIRSAVFLMLILALLSAAGLGYSAVLLPEFFQSSTPTVVKVFSALALACGLCLLGFSGFWWWYRGVCDRSYNELRNWIMSLQRRSQAPSNSLRSVIVHKEGIPLYTIATPASEQDTQVITFPHASF